MTKKSKKQLRQEAIEAEKARRVEARLQSCPLDRNEFLSLIEFVGKNVIEFGHEHDSKYIAQWAALNSVDLDRLQEFLAAERLSDDWDLAVSGDPYDLFGPTDSRLSWMPLEEVELEAMLDWMDEQLQTKGCKHDYTLAKEWLSDKTVDSATTLMALMAKGGGCDCEIVLNVEPDNIYP